MSYYSALIAAWSSATQPPTGVTGAALTGGMTTAQKLAAVNGWTVTGSVPTSLSVTGAQIANCIDKTEFLALTAAQQQNLLLLCLQPGGLLGGSANTNHLAPGIILAYFNVAGATIANLTALAQATSQPWWQANGYSSPIGLPDLAAAGGLS